jgi:thiamine-phosphate pyrophosphorylase
VLDPRALRVEVVTSSAFQGRSHVDVAQAAIDGGATAVQLRAPGLADDELLPLAREIAARCRARGVLSVVNDRPEVAAAAGADGAHVGQSDGVREARAVLGPDRVLGISVSDPDQADEALSIGADYLGVTVWMTATKPDALPVGLEGLRAIVRATSLPVIAIGGVDASNATKLIRAGAAGVAVISAVAGAPDPASATEALVAVVGRALREREAS